MKNNRTIIPVLTAFGIIAAGCTDSPVYTPETALPENGAEIKLQAEIDQINISRADDSGFADADRIGIYVVDFTGDGTPGELKPAGNRADNVRFTFNEATGGWTGDRELYFADDRTPADFYGYYPYRSDIDEIRSLPFSVERNQTAEATSSKLSAYEASDLLWGKTAGVNPSTPLVTITFRHILAGIRVSLEEGTGFDEGEWTSIDKSVLVDNTILSGTVDLTSGNATANTGEKPAPVTAARHGSDFRAVVFPQQIAAGASLLTINVGSDSYSFTRRDDMDYISGKLHKFTIQVNKLLPSGDYTFELLDESISPWESDLLSHDGKLKEYRVVEVPQGMSLEQALADNGISFDEVVNLKIKGELNDADFRFMRTRMKQIEALNLKEALCNSPEGYALPDEACNGMTLLTNIVFPDKLKRIGDGAFRNTNLSGTLSLPEGLEYIGTGAFNNWGAYTDSHLNLTGTLTLPSTLRHIAPSAFENNNFTGSLILPESLEYIGERAFMDCAYMTGPLIIPESVNEIGVDAFTGMERMSGRVQLPPSAIRLSRWFKGCGFSTLAFPGDITAIDEEALAWTDFRGDFIVPESVTRIGREAFRSSKFSHVVLPQKLEFLEDRICQGCVNLIDTVTVPPLIEVIGEAAFQGCTMLDAVIIPASVTRIKNWAFENCHSLTYLRCDAIEPPTVNENAFSGIDKDNFTLEVPEESVDKYRQADGWKEFRRISAYRNFVARPSKINLLNNGGSRTVVLNADAEWEVASIPTWCHISQSSGYKKTELTVTVDRMAAGAGNRSDVIEFRLKGQSEHLTHINVGQYDYSYEEDELVQLQRATRGKGIDLFVIGDGFDAADIAAGIYLDDMKRETEYFFGVEPYTTYRDYFNVYTAIALSDDSGVEDVNHWRNTKFHTVVANSDARLSSDYTAAVTYCDGRLAPSGGRGVILVANTEIYEGVTYLDYSDSFCSVVTKSTLDYPNDARGIVQHEAGGHGFGRLTDEYVYHEAYIQKCPCSCCGHINELKLEHANNYGLNVSLSGKYREVPWSHLIFNDSYGDIVDIYEGGFYHSRGVYRSEFNSCMNNNVAYFSSWSRELIVRNILRMAGEEFSLDRFYAADRRDSGLSTATSRHAAATSSAAMHAQKPVVVKNLRAPKKGGKR